MRPPPPFPAGAVRRDRTDHKIQVLGLPQSRSNEAHLFFKGYCTFDASQEQANDGRSGWTLVGHQDKGRLPFKNKLNCTAWLSCYGCPICNYLRYNGAASSKATEHIIDLCPNKEATFD
jgi:hypothetical protein